MLATLSVMIALAVLAACANDNQATARDSAANVQSADDGYVGTLVKDPPLRPADVVLRDTEGSAFHLAQRPQGKVTAYFFGFTNCEDVCPTTMADLAAARRALDPSLADKVDVVFVTVDPPRDSPRVIRAWLDRYDPTFTGLRGPMRAVHRVEGSLYAMKSAPESPTAGGYEVSHSGSVYVFGPGGTSLVYSGGTKVDQFTRDFARLLRDA